MVSLKLEHIVSQIHLYEEIIIMLIKMTRTILLIYYNSHRACWINNMMLLIMLQIGMEDTMILAGKMLYDFLTSCLPFQHVTDFCNILIMTRCNQISFISTLFGVQNVGFHLIIIDFKF